MTDPFVQDDHGAGSQNLPGASDRRYERLKLEAGPRQGYSERYSSFIRRARLILPVVAIIMITVVFTWSNMGDKHIVPVQPAETAPKTIGKNELVEARFESTDSNNQPYTITAKRAVQGETNENLILLDKPLGDMMLDNGNWVALQADQGAFRQDSQRLLLRGHVQLFHDRGYQMTMEQLNVDLVASAAWSDVDIYGQGPAGTIEAKGMKANSGTGELVFNGPAKLVLNRAVAGAGLGAIFDE